MHFTEGFLPSALALSLSLYLSLSFSYSVFPNLFQFPSLHRSHNFGSRGNHALCTEIVTQKIESRNRQSAGKGALTLKISSRQRVPARSWQFAPLPFSRKGWPGASLATHETLHYHYYHYFYCYKLQPLTLLYLTGCTRVRYGRHKVTDFRPLKFLLALLPLLYFSYPGPYSSDLARHTVTRGEKPRYLDRQSVDYLSWHFSLVLRRSTE